MTAAVIILAIALLILSIVLTVGGAHFVDTANKYIEAETGRRALVVEVSSLKAQVETDERAVKRLNGIVSDLNRKLASARADAVATLDDAALTDALNSGLHSNSSGVPRPVDGKSAAEATAPNRTATGPSVTSGRSVPK